MREHRRKEGRGDLFTRESSHHRGNYFSQTEPESDLVAFGPGPAKKSFLRRPCTIPGLSGWVQVFERLAREAGDGLATASSSVRRAAVQHNLFGVPKKPHTRASADFGRLRMLTAGTRLERARLFHSLTDVQLSVPCR